MQINIDKKTGFLLGIILVLVVSLISVSLNNNQRDNFPGMHGKNPMDMHNHGDADSNTGADIMFLQMMIPHHQQAIDISNLALKVSSNPELLHLAREIIDGQSSEIIQMKEWLKDAGYTTDLDHSMEEMGGMLSDAELAELSGATGKTFDRLWLKGMIEHHNGAIHMTMMIDDARNPEIEAFGKRIVRDQSTQILQMKSMLKQLS